MKSRFLTLVTFMVVASALALFPIPTSAQDAIGIRVLLNPQHLSPLAWYDDQVAAGVFSRGNPEVLAVDGYQAIRDGRSVYVHASNFVNGEYFSNIYIISFSETTSEASPEIFAQALANWKFNINITDASLKEKLRRDTKRLADVQDILRAINKAAHKPELQAGSFIRHVSFSTWPSWQQTLGKALDQSLPVDPTNRFFGCGGESFDATTCWSEQLTSFQRPCRSFVYGYQYFPDNQQTDVYANYELDTLKQKNSRFLTDSIINQLSIRSRGQTAVADCDQDGIRDNIDNCWTFANPAQIDTDNDCPEPLFATDPFCGDACDICIFDPNDDEDQDNLCANVDNCPQAFNPTQDDLDADGLGDACDVATCGNGQIEFPEKCEPGQTENYCDAVLGSHNWYAEPKLRSCLPVVASEQMCQWNPAQTFSAQDCGGYCGDGTLNGSEECDGQNTFLAQFGCSGQAISGCNGQCRGVCSDGSPAGFFLHGFAWSLNTGWFNLQPETGGIVISKDGVWSGQAWSSNLGWTNFTGATISQRGVVRGIVPGNYFTGRINMDPECSDDPRCGIKMDLRNGRLSGFAWSENIGWINFGARQGNVWTSWRS